MFSPDWVSKKLLKTEAVNVEMSLAPPPSIRFLSGGLVILPADDRLIVGVQDQTVASMHAAEQVARKAVELLPHTPLGAAGINFGFEEENPQSDTLALFRVADTGKLSDFGAKIQRTAVSRTLRVSEKTLNITHAFSPSEGKLNVHLNFHQALTSADEIGRVFDGCAKSCADVAARLLREVYDYKVDEVFDD